MQKMDVRNENEVYEQAVVNVEGTTFEVLQLMGDVEIDEYLEEADSVQELKASIPVIGQHQYIKVTFSKRLKDSIENWDTDASEEVGIDEYLNFIPANEEQFNQLTPAQLYALASTLFVDMWSYTTFENPNILEEHVVIQEG